MRCSKDFTVNRKKIENLLSKFKCQTQKNKENAIQLYKTILSANLAINPTCKEIVDFFLKMTSFFVKKILRFSP